MTKSSGNSEGSQIKSRRANHFPNKPAIHNPHMALSNDKILVDERSGSTRSCSRVKGALLLVPVDKAELEAVERVE